MIKLFSAILIIISMVVSAGCDSNESKSSEPLIVDLTVVARALGRDSKMTQDIEQAREQLSNQLVQIGDNFEKQLKEKEVEIEKLSKNEKIESEKELEQLTYQARIQLQKTQQLANQKVASYRGQLLTAFRKEVMAMAEVVAKKRNAPIVYTAGGNILWYSSRVDITDEVIGLLRSQENTMEEKIIDSNVAEKKEKSQVDAGKK